MCIYIYTYAYAYAYAYTYAYTYTYTYIYIQTYACTDFWTLRRHVALPELYTFKDTSAETSYPILRGDAAVPKAL